MSHYLLSETDLLPDLETHEPLVAPSRWDNVSFLLLCVAAFAFSGSMILFAGQ